MPIRTGRWPQERAYQDIRGIIERVREADIAPWRRQLKSVVDFSAQSNEWTYTYGRFNRRYFASGIYSPGRVFREQELITVAVDVSGSMVMTPSDIESAFGVIEELMGKYRVHLVCLDEDLFVPEKRGRRACARRTPGQAVRLPRAATGSVYTPEAAAPPSSRRCSTGT